MQELDNYLAALTRPLCFASQHNFTNLRAIKNLGDHIRSITSTALRDQLDPIVAEGMRKLNNLFKGYDGHSLEEQAASVTAALEVVRDIERRIERLKAPPREAEERPGQKGRTTLSTPIQFVKGVGPALAGRFAKKGIETIEDALSFYPRTYEDRRNLQRIADLSEGGPHTFIGTVLSASPVGYRGGRKKIFEVELGDESGTVTAKWFAFHQASFARRFTPGQVFIVSGEVKLFGFNLEIHHPDIEPIKEQEIEDVHFQRIIPIYSECEGIYPKTLRKIMKTVVDQHAHLPPDGVPPEIEKKYKLLSLDEALRRVHFPGQQEDLEPYFEKSSPAHKRLIFDELFLLEVGLALRRKDMLVEKGVSLNISSSSLQERTDKLPFSLTRAQKRVIEEIRKDIARPCPMNRLLQGDVGSGKTVVAMLAALIAVENGYQAAVMAPTEILAQQHYRTACELTGALGFSTALLTGRMGKKQKAALYSELKAGHIQVLFGTHALIQEGVEFQRLGVTVIDEQHRFGVVQRATLREKGESPHLLVMTATPIPRTLAMTVYGDLDISVLDEMPHGRIPIRTKIFTDSDRERFYEALRKLLEKGDQAFVVYPLVEESQKMDLLDATRMAEKLQKDIFPEITVGLIHGRMPGKEKDEVMEKFRAGEIRLLVATTVIEVGIDVPAASVMVIEHAERFGLSQLHQLRGRVGRGKKQSYCFLVNGVSGSGVARRRLKVMEETVDGFRIAEEDLAIRGPGEFLGTRQSGFPDFLLADIIRDVKILQAAREEAFALVEKDPDLSRAEHRPTMKEVLRRWKGRLKLARIG